MVRSGWHSVAVSIVLATAHSLSIGLLYLVARALLADLPPRDRGVFSLLAAALGVATGVYWMTVGGSFLDPLLVPPMLAALLLLLREDRHAGRRAVLAGALFGAAAALKYLNAGYALAALPLALAMRGLAGASPPRSIGKPWPRASASRRCSCPWRGWWRWRPGGVGPQGAPWGGPTGACSRSWPLRWPFGWRARPTAATAWSCCCSPAYVLRESWSGCCQRMPRALRSPCSWRCRPASA